jgi:hypothetical protein
MAFMPFCSFMDALKMRLAVLAVAGSSLTCPFSFRRSPKPTRPFSGMSRRF